jgi:sugar phosphate isomerase/epimerase
MHLTMLLSSLPLPFEEAVRTAAVLGFSRVDVVSMAERPDSHREALADSNLLVSCGAVARNLPDGQTLDAADVTARRAAVKATQAQIADAAQLGAPHCYLVPGTDATHEGVQRFADSCVALADFAANRKVRLCVEHIPGRALPSVNSVLTWLETLDHPSLALLLDVGHCLITGEDAAAVAMRASARLGYVHFDDNDGVADRHWPLLTGRLTETGLQALSAALRQIGYHGALCLELNAANPAPQEALQQGKALLERLFQ